MRATGCREFARRRWLLGAGAVAFGLGLGGRPDGALRGARAAEAAAPSATLQGPPPLSADEREQRGRRWFTDTVLTDQDGRPQRFYSDLLAPGAPRVTLVHAVFTTCSSACPLIVQKLLAVRAALPEAAAREFWILSLSIDPLNDTPQQLKAFARRQSADAPQWRFLTGDRPAIRQVGQRLGLWVDEPDAHATTLIAGRAAAGHWAKLKPDAPAEALASQLERFWR